MECLKYVVVAYGNDASSSATVFRWFTEIRIDRSSLLNEEQTQLKSLLLEKEVLLIVVLLEKSNWLFDKKIINVNHCPCKKVPIELIRSVAMHKIIYKKLHIKN